MLRAPVSLSHTAYEVLWERAELGAMPGAIALETPVRTPANGARLTREAFAELDRAGWLRGHEVDRELAGTLRALGNAELRYHATYLSEANPCGGGPLVAVRGRTAVLAVLDAYRLHLTPVPAARAADALIARLPSNRPGSGHPLTFRAEELDADVRPKPAPAGAESMLVSGSVRTRPVEVYAHLMRRPRLAMTYLYADRDGRRNARRLIVLDIDGDGRWYITKRAGSGGAEWITAAPATPAVLAEALTDLY